MAGAVVRAASQPGPASVALDNMDSVISVRGLVKTFGPTRALDGLDLAVAPGEVHGFLGPNGSGKSTTIRVLLGLLRSDAGTVSLLGGDPWRDATRLHRRLAYVPGDVTLWPNLSGGEVIDLLGRLRGGLDPARRADLLERFDLDPAKKGRTYSKGNRQKVALVAALSSNVDLLLLDEPTSGLDPLMAEVFRQCVEEERDRGRTVLLSSHVLAEVEALCDRVSIIRKGRTVEAGTLTELRHLTRTSITAELVGHPSTVDVAAIRDLAGVHNLHVDGARLRCEVDTAQLNEVLRLLTTLGVRGLVSQPPTLEELFLRHYEADLPANNHADPGSPR
jgi:ABC-2 type transport system ATP-binding protein